MDERERLREIIVDLDRSHARERALRLESESVAAGLRVLGVADDTTTMFEELLNVLQIAVGSQNAVLVEERGGGAMTAIAATSPGLGEIEWPARVIEDRLRGRAPIALFDVSELEEWEVVPAAMRVQVRSALYVPVRGGDRDALLIYVHSERGYFNHEHVKISGRMAMLAAQALANARMRSTLVQRERLFSIARDMLCITDFDGRFKQINMAWARILGFTSNELLAASFVDVLVHPDHRTIADAALANLTIGRSESETFEIRCRTRSGRYRWLRWSVTSYREEQLLYAIAQDVTDYKRVEELRRKLLQRMERELVAAQTMHGLLLHKREIHGPCWVEVAYRQAEYGGGDWFYVDRIGDYLIFVIADVLGHGTSAAMLAAFGRGYMNGLSAATRMATDASPLLRPDRMLEHLNDAIFTATKGVSGMTCFALVVDVTTGEAAFANGGHLFPLVAPHHPRDQPLDKHDRSIHVLRCLAGTGSRVGYGTSGQFSRRQTTLIPGDKLVLYTDGLVECRDSAQAPYTQQRFMRLLARTRQLTPRELLTELERDLARHVGDEPLEDDFMVTVIQYRDGAIAAQ